MWKCYTTFPISPLCPSVSSLASDWLRWSMCFCPTGHLTAVVNENLFSFRTGGGVWYYKWLNIQDFLLPVLSIEEPPTPKDWLGGGGWSNGNLVKPSILRSLKGAWSTCGPPIGFGQWSTQDTSAGSEHSRTVWRQKALLWHEAGSHRRNKSNCDRNGNSWSLNRCKQQHY